MIFNISKIQYFFYTILIFITYLLDVNIISPDIKWGLNKLWYLSFFILFFLVFYDNSSHFKKKWIYSFILVFIYVIFFSISSYYNLDSYLSHIFASGFCYLILFYLLLFLVSKNNLEDLIRPFLICSIFIMLYSVLVFLGYEPKFYLQDSDQLDIYMDLKFGGNIIGFSGIYLNQNSFSLTLIISIISCFVFLINKSMSRIKKNIIFSVLFLSIIFLMLTMSRAAIFSIFFICLLFILRGLNSKFNIYLLIILTCISLFFMVIFNDFFKVFLDRVNNDGVSYRDEIWRDAWNVFLNNKYLGVGIYKYENIYGFELSAHSLYFNLLASSGIFAFVAWILFVIYIIFVCSKKIIFLKFQKNKKLIFVSISILAILLHQIFESSLNNIFYPLTIFFLLFVAKLIDEN